MREITKYYSEKLDKTYDSVEELEKAEKEKEEADKAIANTNSRKKELASEIKNADVKIETAKKEYIDIRNKFENDFKELNSEYTKKLDILKKERDNALSEKAKDISKLANERYDALSKYYKEFGEYKIYLTDKEAEQERRKIINSLVSAFSVSNIWDMFINW